MKVVFIYNGTESLGIEYISSFIKSRGHQTELLFAPSVFQGDIFINIKSLARLFSVDQKIVDKAIKLHPDLIAFSAFTGNYRWCLDIARAIKRRSNIPIVFGGVHATAVPDKVINNDFIDYVIRGEGEYAMLDLLEHLSRNEPKEKLLDTANICFRNNSQIYINNLRPYIADLDSMPFPDKYLFFNKEPLLENAPYLIMSSRGCPYSCNYCCNNMYKKLYCAEKQHVRRRTVDNVIAELILVKERGKSKQIYFMDDVFTFSQSWLEEFIDKYKSKINLPFYCYVHPLSVTKEIALLLKKGGCYLVGIGVQSGSERIRKNIYNRIETNDKIIQSISYLKAAGLKVQVDHIFGAPTEEEADLICSLSLYKKVKPEIILTFWLTYYPKTQIIGIAQREGFLSEKEINDIEEGHIGYTHGVGSVAKDKINLFNRYELMIELIPFFHNDKMYKIFTALFSKLPFRKTISYTLYTINGLKNNRSYILNKLRYVFSRHNAP